MKHIAEISDGSSRDGGGRTVIEADSMDEAWEAAVEWTHGGEYPEAGCRVLLTVTDEYGGQRQDHVTIGTWDEEQDRVMSGTDE